MDFHRQVSPGDRLGKVSSVRRDRQQPGNGQPRGRLQRYISRGISYHSHS